MKEDRDNYRNDTRIFYKDMRFWLILAMLSAFMAFVLMRYPG